MLKNDIYIIYIYIYLTAIGQTVLEILHFKVDIPRKRPRIKISLNVSVKSGEQ